MKKILFGIIAVAMFTAFTGKVSAQTYNIRLSGDAIFEQDYDTNALVNGATLRIYFTHFRTYGTTLTPGKLVEVEIQYAGAEGFMKVIDEVLQSSGPVGSSTHYYTGMVAIQVSPTNSTVVFSGLTTGTKTFKPR